MPFNILSSLQSEAQKFAPPPPTYNTFQTFTNISANTVAGAGVQSPGLFGGMSACMSSDGQYLTYITNVGRVSVSNDSGATFTAKTLDATQQTGCVAMNSTGQYQYALNLNGTAGANNFWYSSDYGVTWTGKNLSYSLRGVACSYINPQYVLVMGRATTGTFYYSADYGATFTTFTFLSTFITSTSCDVSDDGQTIYFCGSLSGGNVRLFKSTNILTNATTVNASATLTEVKNLGYASAIMELTVSSNGKYIVAGDGTLVSVSSDYGANFTNTTLTANTRQVHSASRDGKYVLVASQNLAVNYSTNYGANWTAMATTDFLGGNQPSAMTISWYGSAVSGDGKKAFIATSQTTGLNKAWFGTNTVV